MRQSVTYKEKSEGFANQTFRLLLVGRSRSGFSSPDSDTYYTLGLAVVTITESSMSHPVFIQTHKSTFELINQTKLKTILMAKNSAQLLLGPVLVVN